MAREKIGTLLFQPLACYCAVRSGHQEAISHQVPSKRGRLALKRDANTGGPLCYHKITVRVNKQLTFLYGLGNFGCVFGEVQVCHVGLQVADGALTSCHAESLYGQICEDENRRDILVNLTVYPRCLELKTCPRCADQPSLIRAL